MEPARRRGSRSSGTVTAAPQATSPGPEQNADNESYPHAGHHRTEHHPVHGSPPTWTARAPPRRAALPTANGNYWWAVAQTTARVGKGRSPWATAHSRAAPVSSRPMGAACVSRGRSARPTARAPGFFPRRGLPVQACQLRLNRRDEHEGRGRQALRRVAAGPLLSLAHPHHAVHRPAGGAAGRTVPAGGEGSGVPHVPSRFLSARCLTWAQAGSNKPKTNALFFSGASLAHKRSWVQATFTPQTFANPLSSGCVSLSSTSGRWLREVAWVNQ